MHECWEHRLENWLIFDHVINWLSVNGKTGSVYDLFSLKMKSFMNMILRYVG